MASAFPEEKMRKQEGFRYWNEATIDGIDFRAETAGGTNLGRCYNRYDTKVTAPVPFTEAQALEFVRGEKIGYGQGHHFRLGQKWPTTEAIYEDYVDSSD
jgi:hypothetical protein